MASQTSIEKPSSETTQALVVHGTWSEEWQKQPILRFVEGAFRRFFDAFDHSDWADWHIDECSTHTPHAGATAGHDEWHSSTRKFFKGPLSNITHHPHTTIVLDSKDGYDVYLQWFIFAKLKGTPHAEEGKVVDPDGEHCDIKIPVFYHFDVVKVNGAPYEGLKIRHLKIIKDTGLVNTTLSKRGVQAD